MFLGPSISRSDTDVVICQLALCSWRHWRIQGDVHPLSVHFCHPQRSCGKVIFLHLSVILFTGGCLPQCMLGYTQPPWADTPLLGKHPLADTAVDSTHHAGMHSCLSFSCSFWQKPCQTRMHSSRMHTAHRNCHFSCHTHPQPPCMPPTTHAPLPCMPPYHACPHHAWPHMPPPTMHAPSPLPPTMHTPHGQNSWHTLVKILPCRNFFGGGDNKFKLQNQELALPRFGNPGSATGCVAWIWFSWGIKHYHKFRDDEEWNFEWIM